MTDLPPEGQMPAGSDDAPLPPETLALDAWHRARGARMVPFAGYLMPIHYDGIIAEHLWTRQSAGLFDVSHMGQLFVSGAGAGAALEALLPSDLTGLGDGKLRYSLLLEDDGGILDDLIATRVAGDAPVGSNGYHIVVNGAVKHDDIGHLRMGLDDDITLNHIDDRALLALQGPKAAAALSRVVPGVEALYFMEARGFGELWISRSGYTGEDGFEISLPGEQAEAFATALCEQPEVKPIGLGARDLLRLEAALPLYGHDLSTDTDPVTAGLTFAIQKRRREQGGFPGATRILKLLADGAPLRRVMLTVDGRMSPREGATINSGTRQVGTVTSGGFSPSLQVPIAMGYVDAAHAGPGTALEIEVRGKRLAATVAAMPLVPHRYHRPTKA